MSPNCSYFRMHRDPTSASEVIHKAMNPYSGTSGRQLIKTTRNCLGNTSSHTLSQHLWNDGNGYLRETSSLATGCTAALCQTKWRAHHCLQVELREYFHLTLYSKLRLNLAVQILSRISSEALRYTMAYPVLLPHRLYTIYNMYRIHSAMYTYCFILIC